MDQPDSWRTLLGTRINKNPQERQRIASALGINPMTLMRWASGMTIPRPQNLRQLLGALPSTESSEWRGLIAQEFPEFAELETGPYVEKESVEIPSEFYARVINTYMITLPQRRFWAISNLVLQQALAQLDPNNVGMSITIAVCMPPGGAECKVRSLRELTGQGSTPWPANLEPQAMFLGIESLAGYTTTVGHLLTTNRSDQSAHWPAHWLLWEESAIACPLIQGESVAGCLLASSTQPDYFSPFRQTLFQKYTELLLLAFAPEAFYAIRDLMLQPMPSLAVQQARFSLARQRVSTILQEAAQERRPITITEAEQMIWQQIEEELLAHVAQHI
jgi:transcriptional regulator with XRE-family HTH domain